jgi:crotonobetainyl-CoA:carnitine CoA-transferase CaiB-like acyl-CoA transferase
MADPHNQARQSFVTVMQPGAGPVKQPGAPFRMYGTPWRDLPAPLLGQDTEALLAEAPTVPSTPPASPLTGTEPKRPLAGVRVVDFTNAVAGPTATFILGDLGADVIKVEAPNGRPLAAAGTAPLAPGGDDRPWERVMTFNELNHAKRGVTLNVTDPRGRDVFLRLVAKSDVVVENFSPRVLPNLKLDFPDLKAVKEDIILVRMPAFGISGPYRDRGSYGPGVDAMSGLSHLTGYPDGPPMKPGNFFCDQNAGVHSAFATMVALWHRGRTGEGQLIELPMIDGEFQIIGDAYIDYAMNGRERRRTGNDHPWMAPHGVYRCRGGAGGTDGARAADSPPTPEDDAWVAIAVETDEQWAALARVIGRPELADDPRYATRAERHAHRAELTPIISAWTRERNHIEAQYALQAAGVPAAAVLNAVELLNDPHVRARHGFEYPDVPNVGPAPYPRIAFTLSRTPVPIVKAAPGFGEDNEAVFGGLLGLTREEIEEFEAAHVSARVPLGTGEH